MRKLKIPLNPLYHLGARLENPVLMVNGSGPETYVWVGDKKNGCYSFTNPSRKNHVAQLRAFAESILNRLSKK